MKITTLLLVIFASFNSFVQSLAAQPTVPAPRFEVASVRLATEDSRRESGTPYSDVAGIAHHPRL